MTHSSTHSDFSPRRLLVVEDNVALKPLVGRMVQKLNPNSEIDWVTGSDQALRRLKECRDGCTPGYDVVLSDIDLGEGISGAELAQRCFDLRIPGRFVFMTGLEGYQSNLPVIQKPFGFREFKARLGPYLIVEPLEIPRESDETVSNGWTFLILMLCGLSYLFYLVSGPLELVNSPGWGVPSFQTTAIENAPLIHAFQNPELIRARRELLEGGFTPLLHDSEKWSRFEEQNRENVRQLFDPDAALSPESMLAKPFARVKP